MDLKLKSYMALAGGILAAGTAQSQVVHTDIAPDTMLKGGTLDIDLNNDKVIDFRLEQASVNYGSAFANAALVYALNNNEVLGTYLLSTYINSSGDTFYFSSFYPRALDKGDTISGLKNDWYSTTSGMALGVYINYSGSTYGYGVWMDVKDKFLGLRFKVSKDTYYGWIRLDVNRTVDTVIVKDYAYEKTPGKEIIAGAGIPAAVKLPQKTWAKMYVKDKQLYIKIPGSDNSGSMTIYDPSGKEVLADHSGLIKNNYDLSQLAPGVYIVRYQVGNRQRAVKILVR